RGWRFMGNGMTGVRCVRFSRQDKPASSAMQECDGLTVLPAANRDCRRFGVKPAAVVSRRRGCNELRTGCAAVNKTAGRDITATVDKFCICGSIESDAAGRCITLDECNIGCAADEYPACSVENLDPGYTRSAAKDDTARCGVLI